MSLWIRLCNHTYIHTYIHDFGKCMIQALHEPETLGLIGNNNYVAMVVVGYGIQPSNWAIPEN